MEQAVWLDWCRAEYETASADRVYLGHETCQDLLPPPERAVALARRYRAQGLGLTLVTPVLTEAGLARAVRLVECLLLECDELEVVCSDWGLLNYLCEHGLGEPVIGRLLAGQQTDPRIRRILAPGVNEARDRIITHRDGTRCVLRYRAPSASLRRHYQSCALDKPDVRTFFSASGIQRGEINNLAQGLWLDPQTSWQFSLHVPNVLISVMRYCPGDDEDCEQVSRCVPGACRSQPVCWQHPGLTVPVFRRDNALYYVCPHLPQNLAELPIDRLVHDRRATAFPTR